MSENIKLLVKKFSTYKVDAYLIPTTDEFLNEYVPEHNRRLEFITGFSGSAGITVISKKMSYLQTDGRYTLQAKQQLPKDFRIVDTLSEAKDLDKLKIGYDPMTLSNSTLCKLERLFKNKNSKLVAIEKNLVDQIWTNKPSTSDRQALLLKKKYSGQDSKDKIKSICHNIDATCDYLLLTNPDSICWLLNIRAHDIPYTPFLLSYLLLEKKTKKVSLFTDKNKVTHIKGCEIFDIGELKKIFKNLIKKKTTIQSDAKNTPAWFHQNSKDRIVWKTDPCELPKAIKNKTEIEGIINAHIQDGIVLTKFLHWLKVNIAKTKIDEISAAEITLVLV